MTESANLPRGGGAVMATRKEPNDSLDYFATPAWATRALCEIVLPQFGVDPALLRGMHAWEPACGEGDMAWPLREYFERVYASDVHEHGFGTVADFLWPGTKPPGPVSWIITNPPFRLAEQFIHHSLAVASYGCAMFVRAQFLESIGRYREVYRRHPPHIAYFAERVPLNRGRAKREATTMTAYVWLVWFAKPRDPRVMWIPPSRAQLERAGDYDYPKPLPGEAG